MDFSLPLLLEQFGEELNYKPELFYSTEPFLIAFFVLYIAIAILYASRQPPQLKGLVDGTLVFGLPVIAFSLQAALLQEKWSKHSTKYFSWCCLFIFF